MRQNSSPSSPSPCKDRHFPGCIFYGASSGQVLKALGCIQAVRDKGLQLPPLSGPASPLPAVLAGASQGRLRVNNGLEEVTERRGTLQLSNVNYMEIRLL